MKVTGTKYTAEEQSTTRKPLELYEFSVGDTVWRYTSNDTAITIGSYTYSPATLKRGEIKYDSDLNVSTVVVEAAQITNPVIEYIAQNPVDVVWVELFKVFRLDSGSTSAHRIFIGQIKDVTFEGTAASARCVGIEYFLNQVVPRERYQPSCNHTLFDDDCGINEDSYKVTTTVTVSDDGLVLTSTDFGGEEDGYFTYGFIEYGDHKRPITYHDSNQIGIKFKIIGLSDGASVTAYAGCDGKIETCRDKFDNVVDFLGFPYIPEDNPVVWSAA